MKRIITLLLVAFMAISLVACGVNTDDPDNKSNPSQSQAGENNNNSKEASPGTQGGSTRTPTPNEPADKNPEGKTKYALEGGVVYFPTDTWEKGEFGGIKPKNCEDESLVVRVGTVSGSVDEQIDIFKNDYKEYQSVEKMTIANHSAVKMIYVGNLGTRMEIVFDTPYTNDEFYSAYHITVRVSDDNTAFFDDATLWEIIESFYYDASLKYSF